MRIIKILQATALNSLRELMIEQKIGMEQNKQLQGTHKHTHTKQWLYEIQWHAFDNWNISSFQNWLVSSLYRQKFSKFAILSANICIHVSIATRKTFASFVCEGYIEKIWIEIELKIVYINIDLRLPFELAPVIVVVAMNVSYY